MSAMLSRKQMTGIVALFITAIIVAVVLLSIDDWSRDFTTNFAELNENHPDPSLRPVQAQSSPDALAKQLTESVTRASRWSVAKEEMAPVVPKVVEMWIS